MATGTTSVPAPTFGANGFTIPQTSAILAGAIADMQAAFGGKLNPNLNTPQGQLASSLSAIVEDCYSQFLLYTNLVDPALSYGRMQDAIGYIYFLNRKPAEPTFVQGDLTGKPSANVTVPVNSLAQATDGTIYASTATVVINAAGTATVGFEAVVDGPISCPAGTLTRIYQARPGWDTVTNPEAGLIGANVESASAFELRRQQSVAQNSMGPAPAVQGAVLSVPGSSTPTRTTTAPMATRRSAASSLHRTASIAVSPGGRAPTSRRRSGAARPRDAPTPATPRSRSTTRTPAMRPRIPPTA